MKGPVKRRSFYFCRSYKGGALYTFPRGEGAERKRGG